MALDKVTILGGGVLGTQIALQAAYVGCDVTIWLRSEDSIKRTQPKVERYSSLMIADLEGAKKLAVNPLGGMLYPRGLIRTWNEDAVAGIDELVAQAKENFASKLRLETDITKALQDCDIAIEAMAENPEAKTFLSSASSSRNRLKMVSDHGRLPRRSARPANYFSSAKYLMVRTIWLV